MKVYDYATKLIDISPLITNAGVMGRLSGILKKAGEEGFRLHSHIEINQHPNGVFQLFIFEKEIDA